MDKGKEIKRDLSERSFYLLDFLNALTDSELSVLYEIMTSKTKKDLSYKDFLSSRYNKATSELTEFLLDTGLSKSERYKKLSEKDMKNLRDHDYLEMTTALLRYIFINPPSFKLEILESKKEKFDDRFSNFIKDYLVHSDNYINYLGILLLLGEALKTEGEFKFLSSTLKRRLITSLYHISDKLYILHLEQVNLKKRHILEEYKLSLEASKNQLHKKDKIISDYKKRLLKQYEKEEINEKKLLEKELKSKDSVIKKLVSQLPTQATDENPSKDLTIRKDFLNLEHNLNLKLKDITQKLGVITDMISKNKDSLNELKQDDTEDSSLKTNSLTDREFNMDLLDQYPPDNINTYTSSYKGSNIIKIGYAVIEDNVHYVCYPDGEKCSLENIPVGVYISDGQFLLTRDKTEFLRTFNYNNSDNYGFIPDVDSFALVSVKDSEYYFDKGDGEEEKLTLKRPVKLKDGQVIGIDDTTLTKFYTYKLPNIDMFVNSINAKGHTPYFINEVRETCAECIEIFSGTSGITVPLTDNHTSAPSFSRFDTILVKEGIIYGVFPHIKFYTNSSFYDNGFYAPAIVDKGYIYVECDGEMINVKSIPPALNISEGQVLLLDEFNNLIQATNITENDPKLKHTKKSDKKEKKQFTVTSDTSILVIGNLNYEENYKTSFAKAGYGVTVIDGFESWNKIYKESKAADKIFVVSSHVSHDNMYKLKDNLSDKEIIYPRADGANRLIEYLKK